jgi:hypothetical protein
MTPFEVMSCSFSLTTEYPIRKYFGKSLFFGVPTGSWDCIQLAFSNTIGDYRKIASPTTIPTVMLTMSHGPSGGAIMDHNAMVSRTNVRRCFVPFARIAMNFGPCHGNEWSGYQRIAG